MENKKFVWSVCVALSCISNIIAQQTKLNYTIAPWLDNKKAALSLTFDDAINGQFTVALPMLNKYGFRSTFFIITSFVQPQLHGWQPVIDAANSGHEIASHTVTHPHMHSLVPDSIAYQYVESNKIIAQHIPTIKNFSMAYPFGDGGGATDSERVVRDIAQKYYTGARAVRNHKLPYNAYDFAKTADDYYKVNSDMLGDSASDASFASHLDETIQAGGWYSPTYHGIENGWIIVKKEMFAQHLEAIEKRKAALWIAPFGDVIKYHKERNCATLNVVSENKHVLKLSLADTLTDYPTYNQPLTINLTTNGYMVKQIKQAGIVLPFNASGGTITFNAVPGKDEIVIDKK
jgi:oligosaccharide reducing-end xylanase